MRRICGLLVAMSLAVVIAGCGGGSGKNYDIGEMGFMDEARCTEYGGTYNEESVTESCMVNKEECERAVGEWNSSMQEGGIETIDFSCD